MLGKTSENRPIFSHREGIRFFGNLNLSTSSVRMNHSSAQFLSEYLVHPSNCLIRFFVTGSMTKGWPICVFSPEEQPLISEMFCFQRPPKYYRIGFFIPH